MFADSRPTRPSIVVDPGRLYTLIRQPIPHRQVIVSCLEGIQAAGIAEIVGTSPGAVGMKVHRIQRLLAWSPQRNHS